ncbi:MAG TPA: hypothetical protein VFJ21_11095 [Mycobacteriales bacterium]|jgi:hypothetical protein|nr:hypothetical protein [Mycobacteriales bacterium]
MPLLRLVTLVAFLGALATTALYFAGTTIAGPIALVMGSIVLTAGSTTSLARLRSWGVPGDHA